MAQAVPIIVAFASVASAVITATMTMPQQTAQMGAIAIDQGQGQILQAEIEKTQMDIAEANAIQEAAELQIEAQRTRSAQIVSGASAGIDLGSQSFKDLMLETSNMYESDRQQILRTGQLQASSYGLSAASTLYGASATLNKVPDANSASMSQAGTLLSGVASGLGTLNSAGLFA